MVSSDTLFPPPIRIPLPAAGGGGHCHAYTKNLLSQVYVDSAMSELKQDMRTENSAFE